MLFRSLRVADPCNVECPVEPYGPNNPVPEVSTLNSLFALLESKVFPESTFSSSARQDRRAYVSLPPLMENGPHDEATVVEQDDDEDELPSAHSPSEEVEENDEDDEPPQKRRRRKNVGSTSGSSPLKEVVVEDKEASESSSDASEPDRKSVV